MFFSIRPPLLLLSNEMPILYLINYILSINYNKLNLINYILSINYENSLHGSNKEMKIQFTVKPIGNKGLLL